jgi:hypothetical protein|tara:strand:- start:14987 stop:15568 length:582 start_codon:yes stop_codon:yes gene_type:complete
MNKHQKYLFILLVVCCSLAIMRRLFTEAYEEEGVIVEVEELGTVPKSDKKIDIQKNAKEAPARKELSEVSASAKQDCSGTYDGVGCPGFCGFEGGKIVNKWITELEPMDGGKECPEDEVLECPATDPCPVDCEGYHEEYPFCPSYCGYEGGTVTRKWITTTPPQHGGTACPTDMEVDCPASDTCISVQNVMTY